MKPDVFPSVPGKKITKTKTQTEETEGVVLPEEEKDLELDSQVSQRVRDWSLGWLQNFYDGAQGLVDDFGSRFGFASDLESKIAMIVGESDSRGQGFLAPKYREGISIFLNTLIDFIENKSADPKNEKSLQKFVSNLYEAMFSFSPNISNHIGLDNLLITTARVTRVPEAQGWFGQNMVGELVYELNWAHEESVERIINKIRKLELSEQLDVVHQLATVGADAIAQGAPGYQAHDRIVRILETFNQESPYPILRYATENALEIIEEEEKNPSLGVVTFRGNAAGARLPEALSEKLAEQSENLKRQVRIVNKDGKKYKMLPIASDAIGLFDHSNTPRQFAQLDFASLSEPSEVDGVFVERLLEGAEARLDQRSFYDLFLHVTNLLIQQDKNVRPITSNILAEKWYGVSSKFSVEEWERIFTSILKEQDRADDNAKKEAILREEIENENLAASNRFVSLVIEKGKKILATLPNPNGMLKEYYDNLVRYKATGNEERAFTTAQDFARFFQFNRRLGTENKLGLTEAQLQLGSELADAMQEVSDFHIASWDKYNEARRLQLTESTPQPEVGIVAFKEIRKKIFTNQKTLQSDILKFLQGLDQKLRSELVAVESRPYVQIELDPNLNPFKGEDSEQLTLLLQNLHNPALRNFIESDLGINLAEIPLRSQIHLLRFLSGQDLEGFNRLRIILQSHSDISNKILNSFLACAENVGYSESILTIAENFDTDTAQAIYDKYLEISSASEQIRDFIYHQTNITGITDNQIQKITQKLLHRANEILKSFAQKSSPAEDTPAERERVLKDLETIKDEAWLITSTFSTLRDSGVAVEFKDIVNMNPEIVTGLELARNRKDVDKMLEIFYDNYHKYPAEFRDSIIDGFRQKLAFDSTDFYILRYKGEIVSFFRFDRRFETDGMFKDFYFGSVNTDTGFTGGRFAEVMFSEALKARAKEGVIEADCDPETEVSSKYIEQGFVATKYYVYKSVPSLGLILDQELNSRLRAKNLSRAEIESLENSPELFVVKYNRGEKVDFSKLSQGYVLSRYIKTKEDILCVFEKI